MTGWLLLLLVLALTVALVVQASAGAEIAAWVAFGLFVAVVVARVLFLSGYGGSRERRDDADECE